MRLRVLEGFGQKKVWCLPFYQEEDRDVLGKMHAPSADFSWHANLFPQRLQKGHGRDPKSVAVITPT